VAKNALHDGSLDFGEKAVSNSGVIGLALDVAFTSSKGVVQYSGRYI
jgi:hypothetical protein